MLSTYTVRRCDAAAGEMDIDFVVHGLGPATSWACTVRPGERLQIAGPKLSSGHPEGADWTLIAGDETALPAIGRWLEQWPEGARAQVFIEVAEASHRQRLVHPEGVEVTWLVRDGAEAGTTTLLFDAIREAEWGSGTAFAWIAGEALTLAPIRRWLRGERGLPKAQVEVTGYWRRQRVVLSEGDATKVDLDATADDDETLRELSEIVQGFALRVAATIGLAEAFGGAARTAADLAAATGASVAGLSRLLRYLEAIGVVEFDAEPVPGAAAGTERYRLTGVGRGLEHERFAAHLHLEGHAARREIAAMSALLDAVRATGEGHPISPFVRDRDTDPALTADRLEHDAEDGVCVTGALAEQLEFDGAQRVEVAVSGVDSGGFAAPGRSERAAGRARAALRRIPRPCSRA